MINEDSEESNTVTINDALQSLPLFDNVYLKMKAMNLSMVDEFLIDLERQLLNEYIEIERTPIQSTLFVSALSQMWIFGLYELIRTWRQRVKEIAKFAFELQSLGASDRESRIREQKQKLTDESEHAHGFELWNWRYFEQAAEDNEFANELNNAFDRSERIFRRIEALRISLAKHEVPKSKGIHAMAPGYGRIDVTTGSIQWCIALKGNEVDLVSRRTIADECRQLAVDRPIAILPKSIQTKLEQIPQHSYGIKLVDLVLKNGSEFKGVFIAWNKEITIVRGFDSIPFDVTEVVDVKINKD